VVDLSCVEVDAVTEDLIPSCVRDPIEYQDGRIELTHKQR